MRKRFRILPRSISGWLPIWIGAGQGAPDNVAGDGDWDGDADGDGDAEAAGAAPDYARRLFLGRAGEGATEAEVRAHYRPLGPDAIDRVERGQGGGAIPSRLSIAFFSSLALHAFPFAS